MKLIFLLVATCLACSVTFGIANSQLITSEAAFLQSASLDDLNAYNSNFFSYFNIEQSATTTCFDDTTANAYISQLLTYYQLAGAIVQGNNEQVLELVQQLNSLNSTTFASVECFQQSQDFISLLNQLEVDVNSFAFSQYLWFQSYYPEWYLDAAEWYNNLENGEYSTAGTQAAPLFSATVANSSVDNFEYMKYLALYSGFFLGANLSAPYSIGSCFNNEEAIPGVEFYTGWGQTVVNSSELTASAMTTAYFLTTGQSLFSQLEGVFACLDQTPDIERLNKVYGYDLLSNSFNTAMLKYVVMYPFTYYKTFLPIGETMNAENYLGAGVLLARFYYQVVQAYPPSTPNDQSESSSSYQSTSFLSQ